MKSILFVCSANQCRSPMAEVLFKQLLDQHGKMDEWRVESAGIWAYGRTPATENAIKAMAGRDLDLSTHRSQPATNELLEQFDLIVVMTHEHRAALLEQSPALDGRIVLLRELGGEAGDFLDPVGGSLGVYQQAAGEIEHILREGFQDIRRRIAGG